MAETAENKVKINSIEDFKKETWIEKVEWIEFKAFSITREELEKFKNEIKDTLPERDKIEKIKAFLTEKARLEVHWEKERKELKESINNISNKLPTWTEEVKKEVEKIDWKLKEITSKEWMEKIAGEWLNLAKSWIGEAISWLFDFLSKIPFIGWLFAALGKMFWFWTKLEETKEIVKDKVENIDKDNIKKQVSKIITDNKAPITDDNLNKSLNSISDEDYKKINAKLEKKEAITLNDLKNLDSFKALFSKEAIKENIKESAEKGKIKLTELLKIEIEKKYNISLDDNKINKLKELIKNDLKINDNTIEMIIKSSENKEITFMDIFKSLKDNWIDTFMFSLKLVTSWIIPISAIGLDFVKSWWDLLSNTVELTLWWLWIKENIDLKSFEKNINTFGEEERTILIALLYRKWWLFLWIISSASAFITRSLIEWRTQTTISSLDAYKASINKEFLSQADLLNNLTKQLWWIEIANDSKEIINNIKNNIDSTRNNYVTLDILKKYENETNVSDSMLKEFKENWIHIEWNPKTIDELKNKLKNNFNVWFNEKISIRNFKNKFWFWKEADLYELNSKLETINKYQNSVFKWNIIWKTYYKTREFFAIPDISRDIDKMTFHFNNVEDLKAFLKQMKILLQQSPELLKWIIDKMPIFVVAWIAATSDKPFFEELQKEFKYLIPIFWPILLLWEAGLSWKDWLKAEKWLEATIWWALLTIDWIFLTKELALNWIPWVWKYIAKPIIDLYSIGRWTAEFWYNIYKVWNAWYMNIIKESLSKTWALKWKVRAIVLALLIIWWWINYAMASDEEKEEINKFSNKDWKIDNEKIKEAVNEMSSEVKERIIQQSIKEWFWETFSDNIKFKVDNEKLTIDSKNKNVQSAFIINNDILEKLSLLWISEYTFNYYWQS